MPPERTFAEIARVLRAGGVFAALDCDWPPLVHWQLHDRWVRIHDEAERVAVK